VDIRTPGKRTIDDVSARTNGHFYKLTFTGDGLFPLADGWSAYAQVSGQFANKNLDSSEKFSLGRAFGVRAYPEGEATGDEGLLLKGELRYTLPVPVLGGLVRFNGFVDHGEIETNKQPFIAAGDNRRGLSAFGLGLDWALPARALVRPSVARRLGNERSTVDTGDDKTRFWLQAVVYF
jgi:hemolysin activation/secretion protein